MPIIKCKMCGGDMEISEDKTFGVCEYCGTSMTLPKVDSEQRAAAFNRGNYFRRIGEFDKALAVYERIVAENNNDAEAHWCCALCRFGIEYVEDPATYEWLPTCHRASFDSFLDDVDYLAAVECSDGVTQRQYQKDAAKIAEVQRGILATSQKEEPFDVFICYKESDDNGQRTVDSTLAQDIYYQLTDKGRRVFFARITLEDKGGAEYEPYIFAALNSAKVMVVIGTKEEYLNAVWVKNEWSRFLSLMKKDNTKLLLPCYRDMNPYDMPDQLSVLQSYDMSKIGFIQDLLRGIDKVLDADNAAEIKKETVVIQGEGGGNIAALTKRGNMALEDGDWNGANDFFDRVLDYDAECAEAYLGKALAEAHAVNLRQLQEEFVLEPEQAELEEIEVTVSGHEEREEALAAENEVLGYLAKEEIQKLFVCNFRYQSWSNNYERQMEHSLQLLADNKNLSRAEKYAGGALKAEISSFKESIRSEMEQTLRTARAQDEQSEQDVREQYERTFAQWEQQITQMRLEAEARREAEYQQAVSLFKEQKYDTALEQFRLQRLVDYRESADYISKIKKIQSERKKKHTKNGIIAGSAAAAVAAVVLIVVLVVIPASKYKSAEALLAAGEFDDAIAAFTDLEDYKDASERITECYYQQADALLDEGRYADAAIMFGKIGNYSDAKQRSLALWDDIAQRDTISGTNFSVGVKAEGTVVAVGDNSDGQCDVSNWENIIAVSAGYRHTVGLKSDGTVMAAGANTSGQRYISGCANIVAVSAGTFHTIGLKSNGTVVATGWNVYGQCDVSDWENIIAVSAGYGHTVGLKADGTVVAVGYNEDGQCDVSDWENIVAVSAGENHTVGLKSDGAVVAVGNNGSEQCNVSNWKDIVAVSAGSYHTVGLKSDGTVVAVGSNDREQCNVSNWKDIVASNCNSKLQ